MARPFGRREYPLLGLRVAMSTETDSNSEHVFLRPDSAGPSGVLLILGGIGLLCLAAVGFVVAILGRTGQLSLHAMTTVPTLLSIAALTAGITMLRTPRRVSVGPECLTVETRRGVRRLGWDEVGCAAVEPGATSQRRRLNVTDVHGKSLVKLDESFNGFDEMVTLISSYVEAKGDDTAMRILRKKARHQAAIMFTCGLFMAFAGVFLAVDARKAQRAARLLDEKGVPGEGEIVRLFLAPNGVTKRVEYRVDGAETRNVELDPDYWDSLKLKRLKSIPVIYVPGEPNVSRLQRGEVTESDIIKTPAGTYSLVAVGGIVALFLLGASPFMWNGWDLAHNSKTKKWSVKRYGKVVWSK
jgi:hypothetical protein